MAEWFWKNVLLRIALCKYAKLMQNSNQTKQLSIKQTNWMPCFHITLHQTKTYSLYYIQHLNLGQPSFNMQNPGTNHVSLTSIKPQENNILFLHQYILFLPTFTIFPIFSCHLPKKMKKMKMKHSAKNASKTFWLKITKMCSSSKIYYYNSSNPNENSDLKWYYISDFF